MEKKKKKTNRRVPSNVFELYGFHENIVNQRAMMIPAPGKVVVRVSGF